ncbi:hypothetical protein Syun_004031 [Stephania yunnanensis]|uniref:Pentatricopeptide repeat-containing protein n=1 Tax=Stephania yunnanensis TaxID=152371 RepID=A0AAP0L5K2_9MAGN
MEAQTATMVMTPPLLAHICNEISPSTKLQHAACSPSKVTQVRPLIENRATKGLSRLDEMMHYLQSSSKTGDALDSVFYNSLVSLCVSEKALHQGTQLRSHMESTGHKPSVFQENQFINLYAKCGHMGRARELFDEMRDRNCVSWNVMISGYCFNQQFEEALYLFCLTIGNGLLPNQSTYSSALRASVGSGDPRYCEQIHSHVMKTGFYRNVQLGNSLISGYAKLGNLEYAEMVHGSMVERDKITWNCIITAYAQKGCSIQALTSFVKMLSEGSSPDEFTFGSLLGTCEMLVVQMLHVHVIKSGYDANIFVITALVNAYLGNGNLEDAYLVFSRMPERNIVAWNAMIAGYMENRRINEGFHLFLRMGKESISPDKYTLASMVKGIAIWRRNEEGKQLHTLAVKLGFDQDTLIGNTLIAMYSKCGELCYSIQAFENIEEPDLDSWNSLICAYVQNDKSEQALILFQEMRLSGRDPDEFTYVGVLDACTTLDWFKFGKVIHGSSIKRGMELSAFVGSSVVGMYSKSGVLSDSKRAFEDIKLKDLIAWNSMITAFVQNKHFDKALKLLCRIMQENLMLDNFTFASILSGCVDAMALQLGRQVHGLSLKSRLTADIAVANALITMYANFAFVREAEQVFYKLQIDKTIVTWTAMIMCYAQNGCSYQALELFNQMESLNVKPDRTTLLSLLIACNHAGFTKEAEKYFIAMPEKYGITPDLGHYACMVDVLGRAGRLEEAENFIEEMPLEPNAFVWKTLLSACRSCGDLHRGERSMERIMAVEPNDSAAYVLLSNIYATHGRWKDVLKVRKLMKENGLKKEIGKSWIEVHNVIHEFGANDRLHTQADDIYKILHELFMQMKLTGYGADPNSILIHEM